MVDADRVTRLLGAISTDADLLESIADGDRPSTGVDQIRLGAIKYAFITAIEGCARVAHHICASEGWGAAESNSEALTLLARHCVISNELGGSLARAVGFRNVLLHQYIDVDDRRVLDNLERVSDLRDFVSSVATWLD